MNSRAKLTYEDCPNVDEHEKCYVCKLLQWKHVGKHMIRHTLRKTVQWMKGMARERCGHNPLMVGLVECFVYQWVVQATMDPIDAEIRKA